MGSTSPPDSPPQPHQQQQDKSLTTNQSIEDRQQSKKTDESDIISENIEGTGENVSSKIDTITTKKELEELHKSLELRDREICELKLQLDKYKLALIQSQVNYHNVVAKLQALRSTKKQHLKLRIIENEDEGGECDLINDIVSGERSIAYFETLHSQSSGDITGRNESRTRFFDEKGSGLVATGARPSDAASRLCSSRAHFSQDSFDDDEQTQLQLGNIVEIIQDVGEIDLNFELDDGDGPSNAQQKTGLDRSLEDRVHLGRPRLIGKQLDEATNSGDHNAAAMKNRAKRSTLEASSGPETRVDENDNSISDGLLTSLSDAAISNLNQLAALQERCESQQHSHQYKVQRVATPSTSSSKVKTPSSLAQAITTSNSPVVQNTGNKRDQPRHAFSNAPGSPGSVVNSCGLDDPVTSQAASSSLQSHDPFSTSSISSQAVMTMSQPQQQPQTPRSISPNSTIQASDLNSSQSLASVVAAAAAAAAAANEKIDNDDHHHHNQMIGGPHLPHHHQLHFQQLNPQQQQQQQQQQSIYSRQAHLGGAPRLISSVLPPPEFYSSLHQTHITAQQQQASPISSLHFTPSTSVTPSSLSLLTNSRRSNSAASSSLLSPICSPNFLRRQFMPADRMQNMMSPSPTSGLATGSSSGTSSILAHLLTGHHQPSGQSHHQRSASALGTSGPTSSSLVAAPGHQSCTPLGSGSVGTGSGSSSAVSPLVGNVKGSTSQLRLNNMQIRHKFGYLGSGRAQFNSPHGFCLGLNQEIVVADTNNHRVCIFDKSGSFITQFGSPGKEEGQLWNPRKVAILHRPIGANSNAAPNSTSSLLLSHNQQSQLSSSSAYLIQQQQSSSNNTNNFNGSVTTSNSNNSNQFSEPLYVVCDRGAERSRMQLFTKDGSFIRKISIHYIDIVAGLAITQNGLIIVVDSVSPTVYIINGETGVLNGWFDCSGHMKEPSDIAVKSDVPGNEYFICDFKGHCVVVFSEQGEYLRKIGHDGLTSYPNGIDISDDGDILVGDSHGNRFHVVVFDRNGNFVSQFECPHVKVSRCCGLKITREGYIVTLAKNNHHVLVLDTIHI